jgi:hypothetical protein
MPEKHLTEAIRFFVYEVPKVLMLLVLIIILKKVLKWQLIGIFVGVVALGIIVVGLIFNYLVFLN